MRTKKIGANEDGHRETVGTSRTTTDWSTVTQQQPVVTPKMEIIDSPDDIRPIVPSDGEHVRSSVVFFSASLSIFAAIGIILFFRKCVTCPSRNHHHRHHTFEVVDPPPAQLVNLMPILTTPDSPVPVATPIQEELLYLRVGSEGAES